MSYQEKRIIFTIITGLLIFIAYCINAYDKFQTDTLDMKSWAGLILIFLGISIAVNIVLQIIFHILIAISVAVKNRSGDNNAIENAIESEMVTDEMDNLIDLKSMRIGFVVAGLGFISGLLSLVLNYSPVIMLNIIFLSFFAGSLLEGFAQLYYYRKGV